MGKGGHSRVAAVVFAVRTAYFAYQGTRIGTAGKINPAFLNKIAMGDAFIFEIDATFLTTVHIAQKRFSPISKYPDNYA